MTLDNCIKRYEIWASDDRISPNIREEHRQIATWLNSYKKMLEQEPMLDKIRADRDRLQENIKALGEDMRKCQKLITDEEVLIGFNMAVALCNKHLAESENKE